MAQVKEHFAAQVEKERSNLEHKFVPEPEAA